MKKMPESAKAVLVLLFAALVIWAAVGVASCIANSDMNPWLKAWLLLR